MENIFLSKFLMLDSIEKYVLVALSLVFGILMVSMYGTSRYRKCAYHKQKGRKQKKILSYITLILTLVASLIFQNQVYSNILIIGSIIQTLSITRIAYKLTNNKYGHEIYEKQLEN